MPSLDVRITKGGDVAEVEYNGARYTKVDRDAQVGDLIRFTSFAVDEAAKNVTVGAFYEVDEIDRFGDPHIIDEAGDDYDTEGDSFEVFAKVDEPAGKQLKVGDLVRYTKSRQGFEGDIARIKSISKFEARDPKTGELGYVTYLTERLADGKTYGTPAEWLEPYTPTAGDILAVDGTTYTLRDRKAEVGEKVIISKKNAAFPDEPFTVGEIVTVTEMNGAHINGIEEYGWGISPKHYLVLEPGVEWFDSAEEEDPKFKVGDIAEVAANNSGHAFNIGEKVCIVRVDDDDDDLPYRVKSMKDDFELWISAEDLKPVQPETTTFAVATKAGGLHVFRAEGESNPEDFVRSHITLIYGKAFFSHPTVFIPLDDIESISRRESE